MRLSPEQRRVLLDSARACFGGSVQVRLFGSRLDDRQRGGDIDLLLETELRDPAQIVAAHSRFLADAYAQLGEQKIDLLIDSPGRTNRAPIFERARAQGQLL